MARSSSGRAKLEGIQRRAKGSTPSWLTPRKRGNRLKSELTGSKAKKSSQSHRKRA